MGVLPANFALRVTARHQPARRPYSYFFYELDVLTKLGSPIVVVNLDGVRGVDRAHLPQPLAGRYTINVSFEPKIVRHALDTFVAGYAASKATQTGPHVYEGHVYAELGL